MASVILVEDEAVVAMAISRALTRQGFEVRHAFAPGPGRKDWKVYYDNSVVVHNVWQRNIRAYIYFWHD